MTIKMTDKMKFTKKIIMILFGQLLSASAFSVVLIPNNIVPAGLGGLATVVHNTIGGNVQLLLLAMSLPIIIWSLLKYERKQVYYAAFCFLLFTFNIGIVDNILPTFKTDPIIASVFGGVLLGISGGIIMRQEVANGPEAIVALYLKEKKGLSIGTFFTVLNGSIILSSMIYGDLTLIIYSIICVYIAGKVTDMVILGGNKIYIINIMSDEYLDITDFIHKQLGRGVTFVQSLDTSNVKKKMMIKTVLTKTEFIHLKEYIEELNDDSFMYVTESAGVIGGGFSS